MKKLIVIFTTILIISCNKPESKVEYNSEQAIEAVEAVVQQVFDSVWSDKKVDAIKKYQTNDFILLEHGELWTNDTIANWCKRASKRDQGITRTNKFDRIKAHQEGNRVYLAYWNHGTFVKDTIEFKRTWLESVVAVKSDSVWKLELMHSTRLPRE